MRLLTKGSYERGRRWMWAGVDAAIWFVAIFASNLLRLDFNTHDSLFVNTLLVATGAAAGQFVIGTLIGPYRVSHVLGSFDETADLARAVVVTGIALELWVGSVSSLRLPRSVPVIAGALAIAGMFALRFFVRSWRNRVAILRPRERRVIVFGAGHAGQRLLRSMMRDVRSPFTPVALLDDDTAKKRLRVDGVRVRGTREDMGKVAQKYAATAVILAIPLADSGLVSDLADRAFEAGLDVLTIPPLREIVSGQPTSRDIRDVNVEDLLGRHPISLDTTAIGEEIFGHSVLVTGAGGSIGSELCRQIARFRPKKLYMLDRDESGLLEAQMSLTGEGLLQGDEVLLADIRDLEAIRAVFAAAKPDLVFHAAALKHLPLLEAYPLEGWKTNVIGTLNVLTAASENGVGAFINISTDKAADPTSVLGYSKRIAERLTAHFARTQPGRYVSVRFGNVLGSRGSVVHTFAAQIARGGPISVTHPDVRRYFMLIPEACQLVLEAGASGPDGEVMVLEMGEQVKILDVAQSMLRMSGRQDIDIVFSGLRPGEKLQEDIFSLTEHRRHLANPLIDAVAVEPIDAASVRRLRVSDHDKALAWMKKEALASDPLSAQGRS